MCKYKSQCLFYFYVLNLLINPVNGIECNSSDNYPPVNRRGPSYSVSRLQMSKNLKCYRGIKDDQRWILLIPGSTEEVYELFSWNWMRVFDRKRWSYCTLQLPENGLGDLQIAAEYIVYAVRTIYHKAKQQKRKHLRRKLRLNIIGHSLGGTLPRFAIRFWPDIRRMINHLISFGPTNHGTIMADAACSLAHCPIAVIQQRINSSFICALNSYRETFPSIKYTTILSKYDEIVRPVQSSEITGKSVENIYIQDICPLRIFSEHLSSGVYDYCGYYLTMNALSSRSLTNISSEECCKKILMPGINLTMTQFLIKVSYSAKQHVKHLLLHHKQIRNEPQLKCSFRTDCIQTKNIVQQIVLK